MADEHQRGEQRSWLRWRGPALSVLLLLGAVLGGVVLVQSGAFNAFLRDLVVEAVRDQIRGDLRIARIEGSVWRRLELTDVELVEDDALVLSVPRATLAWSPWSLLGGQLGISRLELFEPRIWLVQGEDAVWNLARALERRKAAPGDTALRLRIGRLSVRDAEIAVSAGNAPVLTARLSGESAIRSGDAGLRVSVRRLSGQLEAPNLPAAALELSGELRLAERQVGLAISDATLRTRRSRVSIRGDLVPGERADLALEVAALDPEDVAALLPGWPLLAPVAGAVSLGGPWHAARLAAELRCAGATLQAEARMPLEAPDPQHIAAELEVRDAALGRLLGDSALAAVVDAQVRLEGGVAHGRIQLDQGAGSASAQGSLRLGPEPALELQLSGAGLDPSQLVRGGPQGSIELTAGVRVAGASAMALRGSADVALGPSRIGELAIASGVARLGLRPGWLEIRELELDSPDGAIGVRGEVALDAEKMEIELSGRIGEITRLAQLAGYEAAGAVEVSARLFGAVSQPRVTGTLRGRAWRVARLYAESAQLELDIDRAGSTEMQGIAVAALRGVRTPYVALELDADARWVGSEAGGRRLEASLRDVSGRRAEVDLLLPVDPASNAIVVERLDLLAPEERWHLAGPSRVTLTDRSVEIEGFELLGAAAALQVEGRLSREGAQGLVVTARDLPLELLPRFLPSRFDVEGEIEGELRIAGTAASPELDASLQVRAFSVGGRALAHAGTTLVYRFGELYARLLLRQDARHELVAEARVPCVLAWSEVLRAEFEQGLDIRARSAGIDLAFFGPFIARHARDLSGDLSLEVVVGGSLDAPLPEGRLAIRGGSITPDFIAVPLRDIDADAHFAPTGVEIRSLRASSGAGRLEARGDLALANWVPASLDARLAVRDWPAIATRSYTARVEGDLRVVGPLSALEVSGQLHVLSGTLRPDLEFLASRALPRDQTIVLLEAPTLEPVEVEPAGEPPDALLYAGARLDFDIRIERNLWIRHENASLELAGALRVTKRPEETPRLVGNVQSLRGWVDLQGRRFRVQQARLDFTGAERIDPQLDALARYRLPDYAIDALFAGTARSPTLELRSTPELEQADILSVLLFGRPTKELSEGEQRSLGERAGSLAATLGIKELTRSLDALIGLADLGVEVDEVSEDRVSVGAYVQEKTYLSVSQELSDERSQRFTLEYQLWPDWSIVASGTTQGESSGELIWKTRY